MRPVMACARWAASEPEGQVDQERQQPCPSDPLGTWSPFGCPGDSCSSPSDSPRRCWPPWWPRPPWCPTIPHRPRQVGRPAVSRCRPSRPSRRTGHGWPHDDHRGSVDAGRHDHRTDRDRADDHRGAEHDRADQYGRAHHDTAPDDQRRAHHHRARHDRAGNDQHRAGDDHDRAADPPQRPTSTRLGRDRRRAPARPGPAVPAAGAPATTWRDPRQAAGRQAPPPPWLSRRTHARSADAPLPAQPPKP